jgi:CspA family cold shock protein
MRARGGGRAARNPATLRRRALPTDGKPGEVRAVLEKTKNDKKETTMELGNVKWFDMKAGIGQIEPNEGDFVEVDMAALRKSGVRALREGELVAYDLDYTRGRSMAENLRVL